MKDIKEVLENIEHPRRKNDAIDLFEIMKNNIPKEPKLWERDAIGFGDYHYVNKTNEGDMPILSFVIAKDHLTMYFAVGGLAPYKEYLDKIGPYKRGKICLYVSNLSKLDKDILASLIKVYYQDVLDGKAVYS